MSPGAKDLLENCRKPVNEAFSLPPKYYTSNEVTDDEVSRIFRENWIGVGRADMVSKPGDYITLDAAGQNLIILRDKENKLHALANTCRHRGARLLEGEGNCNGIRCPFHSWFYGLDGRLVSAPKMEKVPGFSREENGLVPFAMDERDGFAFVCLAQNPPDLDGILGDFSNLHSDWPLESLATVRRRQLVVDCNWKLFLEVFNEYYHLPFVHPDSIDSLYSRPEPADAVEGAFASQFGSTEGTAGLLEGDQNKALPAMPGLTGSAEMGARYTWIFPNMTFAANRDAMWCYEAYPLGPDQCTVIQSACFHQETVAMSDFGKYCEAYLERLDAALAEDVPALVNQQRGMKSPHALQGRFQPELEPNVASFARWYSGFWN